MGGARRKAFRVLRADASASSNATLVGTDQALHPSNRSTARRDTLTPAWACSCFSPKRVGGRVNAKYLRSSSSTRTRFRKYLTENLLFTFLNVGVSWSKAARKRRIGIDSPRTGAPSMISYLATVSLSLYAFAPVPEDSRLMMASSMCFILIRTSKKNILPRTTSRKQSSIPTSILIAPTPSSSSPVATVYTRNVSSCTTLEPYERATVIRNR
eukprot:scaffold16258_cov141-Isochrysis_galbana.AAC.9